MHIVKPFSPKLTVSSSIVGISVLSQYHVRYKQHAEIIRKMMSFNIAGVFVFTVISTMQEKYAPSIPRHGNLKKSKFSLLQTSVSQWWNYQIFRWLALTLIYWGATLITSVQHCNFEAKSIKMWIEPTLFRLISCFISLNKAQPIEWPVFQCMRHRKGFQRTWCYLAGTAATDVRQNWYREVSTYLWRNFLFQPV